MRFILRLVAWGAAIALLLFGILAVVLYLLFPRERILEEVVPRVELAVSRPVTVADAGISLWPPFGIYVAGLVLDNVAPASRPQLLRVGEVRAQLRVWPLLRRRIHITRLDIRDLEIDYEQFDDTTTNFSDIGGGEGGMVPLLAEHLRVERASVSGLNVADTTSWKIELGELDLVVEPLDTTYRLRLDVPDAFFVSAHDTTRLPVPLDVLLEGSARPGTGHWTADTVRGTLGNVPFAGRGLFVSDSPASARGRLTLGPADIGVLLKDFVPADTGFDLPYALDGQIRVDLEADGLLESMPGAGVRAELVWLGGRVFQPEREWLRFASLTVPMDGRGFHVSGEELFILDSPAEIALVGSWPPEGRLEAKAAGNLDLSPWSSDSLEVGGRLEWSASGQGSLTSVADWKLRAQLRPHDARVEYAEREPTLIEGGLVEYDGRRVTASGLSVRSGRSRMRVDAAVSPLPWSELYQAQVPDSTLADVQLMSTYLDLDAFMPALAGDSAAPKDTTTPPPAPATHARGTLHVDTLVAGGSTWYDVNARVTLDPQSLKIDEFSGRVHDGRVALKGGLGLSEPFDYRFHVEVDSAQVGPLLSRFGGAARHLQGRGNLKADIEGEGFDTEALVQQLIVNGRAELFAAQLVDIPAARATQQLLGLEVKDPIPLASRWSTFKLAAGRLATDDLEFRALDARWKMFGTAGLDASLDYRVDGVLSAAQSARVRLPAQVRDAVPPEWREQFDPLELLKNDQGELELFLRIGGTMTRPSVNFDWDRLQPLLAERFKTRVGDKLKKDLEAEVKQGIQGLFDKLKR